MYLCSEMSNIKCAVRERVKAFRKEDKEINQQLYFRCVKNKLYKKTQKTMMVSAKKASPRNNAVFFFDDGGGTIPQLITCNFTLFDALYLNDDVEDSKAFLNTVHLNFNILLLNRENF